MKFSIYLINGGEGITPMARDLYSEIWRGERVADAAQAKKKARAWANGFFNGNVRLEFVACTQEKADEWKRRDEN